MNKNTQNRNRRINGDEHSENRAGSSTCSDTIKTTVLQFVVGKK